MINISSTNTVSQTVSSCKYIMRPAEAVLVMTTIGGVEPILKQVERFSEYEKIGNRELGIRGRHDAQVMKKLIMSLPNEMDLKDVKTKLEGFLEKTGIGKFPYLVCVHRGEKDGIVNRHVHINFFQRRFEAGNSNKERSFVKKTFAEEVRGIYQEVFGFKKNEAERVRIPRQEFWKFKENREAMRETGKQGLALEVELAKAEKRIGHVGGYVSAGNGGNSQDKGAEVGIKKTDLHAGEQESTHEERIKPMAKRSHDEIDELTERFLAMQAKHRGAKIENKANSGDLAGLRPGIERSEPQEPTTPAVGANPSPTLGGENQEVAADKTTVPRWEFILGQRAYQMQEKLENRMIEDEVEKLSGWQQVLRTGGNLSVVATAEVAGYGFRSGMLQAAAGDPLREIKQAAKDLLEEQEVYERARKDHAADLADRAMRLEALAHEQMSIQPAIRLLGLSKEQKRRLEEIAEAKQKLMAGEKPPPLPPDGQKLKAMLLNLNIPQIRKQVAENLSSRGEAYKKEVMIQEIKRIRKEPPQSVAWLKERLIEQRINAELCKPVGMSKCGLNPRKDFSDNVTSAISKYISDGSPVDDKQLSDRLDAMRQALGRPMVEAIAKELELRESMVAGVFSRLSKNIIGEAVQEAVEEQQQQERKKDRGMGRGM